MTYSFFLDELEIEEPIGFDDFELSMRRDEKTHGIQFEASTGSLRFYGDAARYLIGQYDTYGIKANVVFAAQEFCDDPYTPFEEISGRLNFGQMKENCGDLCTVEIPLEEEGCKVVFKNRYDQKVDLDLQVASDGVSALANYAALGITLDMPAKALQSAVDGSVKANEDNIVEFQQSLFEDEILIRPTYATERYNNIQTGQLIPVSNWDSTASPDFPITPQLLFEDTITCFSGDFDIQSTINGLLEITDASGPVVQIESVYHQIIQWDGVGNIFDDGVIMQSTTLFTGEQDVPFSLNINNTLQISDSLPEGIGLYAGIRIGTDGIGGFANFKITFNPATSFTVNAVKRCPATTAQAYLVHETMSRIAESITNNCVRVKSDYYGRIDSQPFAADADGCGGLRMLTSGLKIRNAPNGKFFASMKDIFEGLNPIDNIGFDIMADADDPKRFVMRVEDVGYFYQDDEVFVIDNIPKSAMDVQEPMHYAKINVGYKKWEVEGVNGLDEFNSTREYRTSLDTISTTLEITSQLIAGSYPYEITRQQNFADSGAADTKFDNDIFIITLLRNAYDFEVELDNVSDASGFFDPDTIINAKLSPLRNLMRWYKTIAAGYRNLSSSENKLFFSAGTGNFNATMETVEGVYDELCKPEAMPISESQHLFVTHFARQSDYTPLWKNELESFDYPLNISEYKQLKDSPYGYISYRCGNSGEFEKGFIKEIKFKPAKGLANFTLLKKWE